MALTYTDSGNKNNTTETSSGTKTGNQSVSGSGTQNTSGTQTQNTNQVQATNQQNMTPDAIAALDAMVNSLSGRMSRNAAMNILTQQGIKPPTRPQANEVVAHPGGGVALAGTPNYVNLLAKYNEEMAAYEAKIQQTMAGTGRSTNEGVNAQQKNIDEEIATNRAGREGYSKANAIQDSNAFTDRAMREMLEKVMPSINAAVEASGTSGGAVSGLLRNDAVARAAENAATLSVQAAVEYGKINNDASQIIAGLVSQAPAAEQLLLQALGVSKGAVQSGASSTSGTNTTTTTGSQNTTENKNMNTSETANSKSVKAPTELEKLLSSAGNKPSVFGNYTMPSGDGLTPAQREAYYANATLDRS
jgi:hypothetical protein